MTIDVTEGLVERVRLRVGGISPIRLHTRHDHPDTAVCLCGHGMEVHEHFRPGSDCGVCGRAACAGFRPAE